MKALFDRYLQKQIGLNYPALIGGYGAMELSRVMGNALMALPFTIVVGRDGNVLMTQLGPIRRDQLDALISSELR